MVVDNLTKKKLNIHFKKFRSPVFLDFEKEFKNKDNDFNLHYFLRLTKKTGNRII